MKSLSIITINLNNQAGLKKTIASIIAQTAAKIEYLIIDGGSSDGSVEVIKQNLASKKISYWESERDNGVYHAMNKGIAKATGEYLLFLNSGDYLLNDHVIADVLQSDLIEDIIYGGLAFKEGEAIVEKRHYPGKLTFNYFFQGGSLPHPATFIRKDLFKKVGFYNEKLKIVSDWEFWLRNIFLYNASYRKIELMVSVFSLDGISSNSENYATIQKEKEYVYKTYFSGFIEDYIEYQNLSADLRVKILKQLKEYPKLSKLATGTLLFLSRMMRR